MKIYYFNDTKTKQYVHTKDFYSDAVLLEPAQGKLFEYSLPENYNLANYDKAIVPFVKVWETGVVLISYMEL